MECPNCHKDWPMFCEQQIAIELKGHCIACQVKHRIFPDSEWTKDDAETIRNVAVLRRGMHIAANFDAYLESVGEKHASM